MDSVVQSVIEVAGLISIPLSKAVYGSDFLRGASDNNGLSFFIDKEFEMPLKLSVIGEVKGTSLNECGLELLLGRPAGDSVVMNLFWRQQISMLERIELADAVVDEGLQIVRFSAI
jgi:hypothetical protein